MACSCDQVEKSELWSAVPEYKQPTEIQPGENIDCYMQRAGSVSGLKNDIGSKTANQINNTSLTSDLDGNVNTTFTLTPGSTRTATQWDIAVNGNSGLDPLTELSWDSSSGTLSGQVAEDHLNQQYNVTITASDSSGQIDARSFTFFPKSTTADQTIRFVTPLQGNTSAVVTCGYGPRAQPAPGASTQHMGLDFAMSDHSQGVIVAAADGVITKAGPASGFGNWVVIDHHDASGALVASTVYGHMNDGNIFVNVGDKVAAGQKIALEGNAGIGSGMHLHFELHKGGYKNPVDPAPYLSGAVTIANNNDPSQTGPDGTPLPTDGYTTMDNGSNTGMTTDESSAPSNCPDTVPNSTTAPPPNPETPPTPPTTNKASNRSSCTPSGPTPDSATVIAQITAACNSAGLSQSDTNFIITVATIESNLDPFAKNPTSSATGLYQFLDALAVKYYGIIGVPCTCENRCNVTYATQAMIAFYQQEMVPYWNNFIASGKATIAGKSIVPTSWSGTSAPHYAGLTQGDFLYGIVHHDGVGNGVNGVDRGGVAYWRSKTNAA